MTAARRGGEESEVWLQKSRISMTVLGVVTIGWGRMHKGAQRGANIARLREVHEGV